MLSGPACPLKCFASDYAGSPTIASGLRFAAGLPLCVDEVQIVNNCSVSMAEVRLLLKLMHGASSMELAHTGVCIPWDICRTCVCVCADVFEAMATSKFKSRVDHALQRAAPQRTVARQPGPALADLEAAFLYPITPLVFLLPLGSARACTRNSLPQDGIRPFVPCLLRPASGML